MPSRRAALAALLGGAAFVLGPAIAATAAPAYPPVTVDPNVVSTSSTSRPGAVTRRTIPTEVLGEQISRGADGSLPVTGGDVLGLAAIGAAAALGGGILVRASRRTRDVPDA